MQCDYTLPSPRPSMSPFEVQVPSLASITIPPVKDDLYISKSASSRGWTEPQRTLRPTLQRIDTAVAAPRLPLIVEQHTTARHAPSRSMEFAVDYFGSPPSLSGRGGTRGGDLLAPVTADLHHGRDGEMRRRGTISAVPGPYISFASRGSSSAGTSATSGSPSLYPPSPLSPSPFAPSPDAETPEDTGEGELEVDQENAWNLIPYNIPWGSSYHGYKSGTLPGPDGKCIFLRSPTPLKNQRTGQACEKCRERKAKCSGTRPSCARCITRGHVCEYGPEIKRTRPSALEGAVKEEEDEEETLRSLSRGRSRSNTGSPTTESSPEGERRRTVHELRTAVAIPPPPMLRRHSTFEGAFPSKKRRRAPLSRQRSDYGSLGRSAATIVVPTLPGGKRASSSSSASTSEPPSEPESLPPSGEQAHMHTLALTLPPPPPSFASDDGGSPGGINPTAEQGATNETFATLQQYRFPHSGSPESLEPHGMPASQHEDMELDLNYPVPVDLPTPTMHAHLHAPNPLRYSTSMPQLPHVDHHAVHHTHVQDPSPTFEHTHEHSPGAGHARVAQGGYMYFHSQVCCARDGYSTASTTGSTEGTDLEYEFMSSPVVMHPWAGSRNEPGAHLPCGAVAPAPLEAGDEYAHYSFDISNAVNATVCSVFPRYPGMRGDSNQEASTLALLEELDLHRHPISNPFDPVVDWMTA